MAVVVRVAGAVAAVEVAAAVGWLVLLVSSLFFVLAVLRGGCGGGLVCLLGC